MGPDIFKMNSSRSLSLVDDSSSILGTRINVPLFCSAGHKRLSKGATWHGP